MNENLEKIQDANFIHLHNHSQFSVLQSTTSIPDLVEVAAKHKMPAVALTDHANMMGAFHFVNAVQKHNKSIDEESDQVKIKPIIGCEFFVCEDHLDKSHKDNGYQIVLLAKNKRAITIWQKCLLLVLQKVFTMCHVSTRKSLKNTRMT